MPTRPDTCKIEPIHVSFKDSTGRRLDAAIRTLDEAFEESDDDGDGDVSDGSELNLSDSEEA
jgi:hypothetical protein